MKSILALSILFCAFGANAAKVDTVSVHSNSMNKDVKCVIIRPQNYSTSKKYPAVYLLHGYGGNYSSWVTEVPAVKTESDNYQMILVCPDGGYNSWYLDAPLDSSSRYETFCSKELVEYVDKNYKTIPDAAHRAITGMSMGGHGGLYLGIRHSDIFANAGSFMGGVDIRPFTKYWDITTKIGTFEEHPENWEKFSVINQLDQLKDGSLNLIIDCGFDDFFFQVNRSVHEKLLKMKIKHEYIERPGVHDWKYCDTALPYQMLFFSRCFAK